MVSVSGIDRVGDENGLNLDESDDMALSLRTKKGEHLVPPWARIKIESD
jgi:hypothetical protein